MSNVYDGRTYYYIIFMYNVQRHEYTVHCFYIVITTRRVYRPSVRRLTADEVSRRI